MGNEDFDTIPARSSLANKLLKVVLGVYLLLAALTTGIQLFLEYDNEKQKLTRDINKIAETFEPIFAQAIWNLDDEQIQSSVEGILISTNIIGIKVVDDYGNELATSGITSADSPYSSEPMEGEGRFLTLYNFDRSIIYSNPVKGDQLIGNITLYSSSQVVLRRAAYTFIITIVNAVIKTFLLWMIFTYVVNRLVSYPMSKLTYAIQTLNPDSSEEDYREHRQLKELIPDSNDELGNLIQSFLDMEEALSKKNRQILDYQKHLEEKVEERTQELELASKAKSDFLANMSHEIRTPLNGVLGIAELLKHTTLTPKQVQYVNTIQSSGDSLLGIINDILDYSKIEAGKMEVEYTLIDLRRFVDETSTVFALQTAEKNLDFVCYVEADVPNVMVGDPTRLRQVLTNLLSNALKFTHRGQVILEVNCESVKDGYASVTFSVTDTGIGLDEGDHKRIFQSFSQADQSTTRKFGGTGLGLSISRNLVELMGGEIHVDSRKGEGSRFWFTIPMYVNKEGQGAFEKKIQDDKAILENTKCLIIDNHDSFYNLTAKSLQHFGIETSHAWNAAEARQLDIPGFDYILIENDLPDLSGMELAQKLITEGNTAGSRVILTGLAKSLPNENRLAAAGISHTLEKPVSMTRLVQMLVTTRKSSSEQEVSLRSDKIEDYSSLKVMVAEDNQVNQLVLLGLLKKFGIEADLARDGLEAVELFRESVSKQGYDVIFMDCEMVNLDGWEATRQIRAIEVENDIEKPAIIIAVSAHALNIEREKAVNSGMSDYLPKPITTSSLAEIMEIHVNREDW